MSLSARSVLVLLAAILGVALTVTLGCWQLRRADQKLALAALTAQRLHDVPWTNADWPCGSHVDLQAWPDQRPVKLSGQWLADKVVYLDNRVMADRTGFYVVTPFRLDPSPTCGPAIVLIQRGWVPRHQIDRQQLPAVTTPVGLVWVMGKLVADTSLAYQLGQESAIQLNSVGPLLRQNMSRADWSAWLGYAPAMGAVLEMNQSKVETAQDLMRMWSAPETGVGKHQAYAAQWFVMALIITGLYVWFQLLRPNRAP